MSEARYRVRDTDPDYGPSCPLCASPKSLQARKCQACETDRKRADRSLVDRGSGPENPNWRGGYVRPSRAKGGSSVPAADHPWRVAEHAGAVAHRRKQAA